MGFDHEQLAHTTLAVIVGSQAGRAVLEARS